MSCGRYMLPLLILPSCRHRVSRSALWYCTHFICVARSSLQAHQVYAREMETCSACRRADDGTGLRKPRVRTAEQIQLFGESDVSAMFPNRLMGVGDPLLLCKRTGCMLKLFGQRENRKRKSHAAGPRERRSCTQVPEPVGHLQRRPYDRYCTSPAAVDALVAEVHITGLVLDMCGGRTDAVALRLGVTCSVVTNDLRR